VHPTGGELAEGLEDSESGVFAAATGCSWPPSAGSFPGWAPALVGLLLGQDL